MPEKTPKCRRKSQTTMPFVQSFVRSQTNKKKVIAHGDCQEFSFLYRRTLKQMKQKKRSSGNVVHLFLQLSVLLHQVSKKQHRMKKKWLAPDEEKNGLRRTLQPNKNAVISEIKKRHSQLPKSSEKIP